MVNEQRILDLEKLLSELENKRAELAWELKEIERKLKATELEHTKALSE
jgi:hypothetical protein